MLRSKGVIETFFKSALSFTPCEPREVKCVLHAVTMPPLPAKDQSPTHSRISHAVGAKSHPES